MCGAGSCSPEVKTRFRSWLSGFTIVRSSPSPTFRENGCQRPTAGSEDPQVQAGGWKKPPCCSCWAWAATPCSDSGQGRCCVGFVSVTQSHIFSWPLDPEVRVQGAVRSWAANVWADGGERAEGSRRRKEGGSSLGQGKAAATFWESSFKTAFLFTNFYFGTNDKPAGKFLTPLFPGSAHCQLLPLPRAAFLTNPDGFCKQPWLCALCPEAQAASCAAQHARLTHQALCSAPPAVLPAFFPCLSMFGGTRLSHQGVKG